MSMLDVRRTAAQATSHGLQPVVGKTNLIRALKERRRLAITNAFAKPGQRRAALFSAPSFWAFVSKHGTWALASLAGFSRQTPCHQLQLVGSLPQSRTLQPASAGLPGHFTGRSSSRSPAKAGSLEVPRHPFPPAEAGGRPKAC